MRYIFTLIIFLITKSTFGQLTTISHQSVKINQTRSVYIEQKFKTQIQKAEKRVTLLMKEKNIPDLSIAVGTKDKIIWAKGFGFSDIENKVQVSINSKLRIGSVSKTLTTLAIGKLMENNKLKLSDNIRNFVPYFPEKAYTIYVRELANHTSGNRDYKNEGEYLSYKKLRTC